VVAVRGPGLLARYDAAASPLDLGTRPGAVGPGRPVVALGVSLGGAASLGTTRFLAEAPEILGYAITGSVCQAQDILSPNGIYAGVDFKSGSACSPEQSTSTWAA
jgi:hypothetical protein